jgi:hypothetical protein
MTQHTNAASALIHRGERLHNLHQGPPRSPARAAKVPQQQQRLEVQLRQR